MSNALATTVTPDSLLPCPAWCIEHKGLWHISDWRIWQENDSPEIQLQIIRQDEADTRTGEVLMGDVDVTIGVESYPCAYAADGGCATGFASCNDLRDFSAYLAALAEEADPHHLGGCPVGWWPGSSGPDGD